MSLFGIAFGGLQRQHGYAALIVLAVLGAVFAIWCHCLAAGFARFAVRRAEAQRNVDAEDPDGMARNLSHWMQDQ